MPKTYLPEPKNFADPVIRRLSLLSETSRLVSERSGGPPYPGAPLVDDQDGQFVWAQIAGHYLYSNAGVKLKSNAGVPLISSGA